MPWQQVKVGEYRTMAKCPRCGVLCIVEFCVSCNRQPPVFMPVETEQQTIERAFREDAAMADDYATCGNGIVPKKPSRS